MSDEPTREKSEGCESCDWDTTELKWYPFHDLTRAGSWMCHVCARTSAGRAHQYPTQYPNGDVLRTVAWQTNYLASLIKQGDKQ